MKLTAQKMMSLALLFLFVGGAHNSFAFSNGKVTVEKTYSVPSGEAGSSITVTCRISNQESEALRGLYLSEHLPAALEGSIKSVKINDIPVQDFSFSKGPVNEVFEGCRTWRIVLEQPPLFIENNPTPAKGVLEIQYEIWSSEPATYELKYSNWIGRLDETKTSLFGFSAPADVLTVSFYPPILPSTRYLYFY